LEDLDLSISEKQQETIDALGPEFLGLVDEYFLSESIDENRKVFRLVLSALLNPEFKSYDLPMGFYVLRIKSLVKSGKLISEGNMDYPQYSEVRLSKIEK